ncbi:MAG: seryl-tRNA synthetase [Thermoleophilaceae bacterium]|jgi:seryl-tRNA synthetase|nr:seryl-tRNA synthetase [Thermoleophilaceae bacterium]
MLDLRKIREDPQPAREALARRGVDAAILDEALELDERRRKLLPELEDLRARKNQASKQIGELQRSGEDASEAIAETRKLSEREKELEEELRAVEERRTTLLVSLPNLPDPTAADEDEVIREVGEAGRTGRNHVELLGDNLDMERAARVSGSRFVYLKGPLVRLELALVQWTLSLLEERGFIPVIPPVLVREHVLFGTGYLPDTEQQIYSLPDDDLYLVGTSEAPLASLHADEILGGDELPRRYAGFSPCFRREAGAAGKDTQGMFRVHQFDKVEMFSFVEPDESPAEHERLLAIEEEILQALAIPYRVVNIAVTDLGASAAKKYDLEAWLPGQGRYRELTSCSNTTDFQARRLDIRFRPKEGESVRQVHTLNGTAVAVGRTIIGITENHQNDDGSVDIPEVLHPFGAPVRLEPASA